MQVISALSTLLTVAFFVCCGYQLFYLAVPFFKKDKPPVLPAAPNRYAVLICARNEAAVLPQLLRCLRAQDYPAQLFTVFAMADNCTDATATLAAEGGAVVYRRTDPVRVGKGYALQALLTHIEQDCGPDAFDGYFVFDADNLLQPDYITRMNETFSQGYDVVTGYRNSKNYGDNWISAGYALWFLRESEQLNHARGLLGVSCAVSGTGFLFSRQVLQRWNGWPFHLLTEDLQFTAANVLDGRRVGYCPAAVLYDEQPTTFAQSWQQRLRWAKGYVQVLRGYGLGLVKGMLRVPALPENTVQQQPARWQRRFACYDMAMVMLPALVLTVAGLVTNLAAAGLTLAAGGGLWTALQPLLEQLAGSWLLLFFLGWVTTVSQWHSIHTVTWRKVVYTFTFPLFMLTYIPVSVAALFVRVRWQPIRHTVTLELEQLTRRKK